MLETITCHSPVVQPTLTTPQSLHPPEFSTSKIFTPKPEQPTPFPPLIHNMAPQIQEPCFPSPVSLQTVRDCHTAISLTQYLSYRYKRRPLADTFA